MLDSCGQPNVFEIYRGNAKVLKMKAVYANSLTPLDLTAVDEIDIAIPNADGTFTHYLYSDSQVTITGSPLLGSFQTSILSAESLLFNVGTLQTINVTFEIDGEVFTVPYLKSLNVFDN